VISDRATNSQVAPRVLLEVEWHFGENGVEPGQREGNAMAQRRTSKSQVRRPEPSDKMRDDLVSMLLAGQMDFAADYVRRGRAHRNLTDAELREEWKAAFRAHSQEPRPGLLRRTLQDFQAELDLRKLDPPFDAVREDLDRAAHQPSRTIGSTGSAPSERFPASPDNC
jgi:hypothetical protein